MQVITAKNLSLGYDSKPILENLNFSVEEGDYLCIVGENGSGKSTLMRTILRLQKPVSGEIVYGEGLKASGIGYLPQQMVAQRDFPASVREIVISGFQGHTGWRPFYSKEEKQQAEENMRRMGIEGLKDRCYRELSGGQQQRVLLARALCATRRLLLLDEPVSGLDPVVTAEMYQLIQGLNDEGLTVIMISHDIEAAVRYASHILHIGDRIFFGTRDEYVSGQGEGCFMSGAAAGTGPEQISAGRKEEEQDAE